MKIEVLNGQLNQVTIEELNKLTEKDMNPKYAFLLLKIVKELDNISTSKAKVVEKLYKKYGTEVEDGGEKRIQIAADKVETFITEMNKLEGYKNVLDFERIKFEDMEVDGKISVKTIGILSFLFVDTTDEKELKKEAKEAEVE